MADHRPPQRRKLSEALTDRRGNITKTHLPPKVEARAGIALPVTAPDKSHAFRRSALSRSIRLSGSSSASSFGGSGITSLHRADTLRPS